MSNTLEELRQHSTIVADTVFIYSYTRETSNKSNNMLQQIQQQIQV